MKLTGLQMEKLADSIAEAFTPTALKSAVRYTTNRDLDDITLASSKADQIFDMLDAAEREGWIEDLLAGLKKRNQNPSLANAVDEILGKPSLARELDAEMMGALAAAVERAFQPRDFVQLLNGIGRTPPAILPAQSFGQAVLLALYDALRQGWIEPLVARAAGRETAEPLKSLAAALQANDMAEARRVAGSLGGQSAERWLDFVTSAPIENAARLERLSSSSAFANPVSWSAKLARVERQVCLVRAGGARATGFLVGSNLVLTCFHAVRDVAALQRPPDDFGCVFDFKGLPQRTLLPGQRVSLALPNWLVDHSEYGVEPAQMSPSFLNYALLQLAEPVGERRGWIRIPKAGATSRENEPFFVLHHAQAGPLKLSMGQILAIDPKKGRLIHDAPTFPGAAGAPCLDGEHELVAMHEGKYLTDEREGPGRKNQAIPIDRVLARMQERDIEPFWESMPPAPPVEE